MREKYRIRIEGTGASFSAWSPDVPGCVATGRTADEAGANMREAIAFHVRGLVADGQPPPPGFGRLACPRCHKVFRPKSVLRKFCSDTCRRRAWEGVAMARPIPRSTKCRECGKAFRPTRAHSAYCSLPCRRRAAHVRRTAKFGRAPVAARRSKR